METLREQRRDIPVSSTSAVCRWGGQRRVPCQAPTKGKGTFCRGHEQKFHK